MRIVSNDSRDGQMDLIKKRRYILVVNCHLTVEHYRFDTFSRRYPTIFFRICVIIVIRSFESNVVRMRKYSDQREKKNLFQRNQVKFTELSCRPISDNFSRWHIPPSNLLIMIRLWRISWRWGSARFVRDHE